MTIKQTLKCIQYNTLHFNDMMQLIAKHYTYPRSETKRQKGKHRYDDGMAVGATNM